MNKSTRALVLMLLFPTSAFVNNMSGAAQPPTVNEDPLSGGVPEDLSQTVLLLQKTANAVYLEEPNSGETVTGLVKKRVKKETGHKHFI